MTVNLQTEFGDITVTEQAIGRIAGSAALECYGLVGMVSRQHLKDGIAEWLGRENIGRGIEVFKQDGEVHIHLYIIVKYGTKISEVAQSVQHRIKYVLNNIIGLQVNQVHVTVQGVRGT